MDLTIAKPMKVTAGSGSASAGIWLRARSNPDSLLLPTVAHILFGRNHSLRLPVRVNGIKVDVVAAVPLVQERSFFADAALLAMPPEPASASFFPARGHLNRFCKGLVVRCVRRSGAEIRGRLVEDGWSSRVAYSFGSRCISRQWLVRVERSQEPGSGARPGDSGAAWTTLDGVAVGLQIGVVRHQPHYAFLTPFETICELFDVAIAS